MVTAFIAGQSHINPTTEYTSPELHQSPRVTEFPGAEHP